MDFHITVYVVEGDDESQLHPIIQFCPGEVEERDPVKQQ